MGGRSRHWLVPRRTVQAWRAAGEVAVCSLGAEPAGGAGGCGARRPDAAGVVAGSAGGGVHDVSSSLAPQGLGGRRRQRRVVRGVGAGVPRLLRAAPGAAGPADLRRGAPYVGDARGRWRWTTPSAARRLLMTATPRLWAAAPVRPAPAASAVRGLGGRFWCPCRGSWRRRWTTSLRPVLHRLGLIESIGEGVSARFEIERGDPRSGSRRRGRTQRPEGWRGRRLGALQAALLKQGRHGHPVAAELSQQDVGGDGVRAGAAGDGGGSVRGGRDSTRSGWVRSGCAGSTRSCTGGRCWDRRRWPGRGGWVTTRRFSPRAGCVRGRTSAGSAAWTAWCSPTRSRRRWRSCRWSGALGGTPARGRSPGWWVLVFLGADEDPRT